MAPAPVDKTAFAVFDMRELDEAGFDAGLASAGDGLAVVFFWGVDCFNCEIAKKAMLAKPDEIRALGLNDGSTATCTNIATSAAASCCTVCRHGFSFAGASASAGRPAGMASRSSKRQ